MDELSGSLLPAALVKPAGRYRHFRHCPPQQLITYRPSLITSFGHRPTGLDHRLVAASERVDVAVTHALRGVARERGAEAAAAIHDDFRVRIGIKFFEVALQNSLAQMLRLDGVTGA